MIHSSLGPISKKIKLAEVCTKGRGSLIHLITSEYQFQLHPPACTEFQSVELLSVQKSTQRRIPCGRLPAYVIGK